jgi:hypothetical protein
MKARPRPIVIRARVTIKGGTRSRVIINPEKPPETKPRQIPRTAASRTLSPGCPLIFSMTAAAATPESATTDPTERSMPPVMITKVMPTARIP